MSKSWLRFAIPIRKVDNVYFIPKQTTFIRSLFNFNS